MATQVSNSTRNGRNGRNADLKWRRQPGEQRSWPAHRTAKGSQLESRRRLQVSVRQRGKARELYSTVRASAGKEGVQWNKKGKTHSFLSKRR